MVNGPAVRLLAAWCLSAAAMNAQQARLSELGIGMYGQSGSVSNGVTQKTTVFRLDPFIRYTVNVDRSLAFEASVADSVNSEPSSDLEGGHELLALLGVKAGIRRSRIGVYGRLDAGATSYSRGTELLTAPPRLFRQTHFTLQPGAAVEAYVGVRTIIRADVDANISAEFRSPVAKVSDSVSMYSPGKITNHLGLAISLERQIGSVRTDDDMRFETGHISVGALFPLQIREHLLQNNTPVLGGGGAWIEIPTWGPISTDVVALDFPEDDHTSGYQDGGTTFSAFVGPKLGFHLRKLGLFVKARPGISRFTRTLTSEGFTNGNLTSASQPQIQLSLDTGGVLEYSISRHLELRAEAGDALIFYHGHNSVISLPSGSVVVNSSAITRSSILFLNGFGWRF